MMLNTNDRLNTVVIVLSGLALVIWSFYLFAGYKTILLILGLSILGLGYAFKMGTVRRSVALTLGSLLVVFYSYWEASWIFFWLNIFFAVFSGYYIVLALAHRRLVALK